MIVLLIALCLIPQLAFGEFICEDGEICEVDDVYKTNDGTNAIVVSVSEDGTQITVNVELYKEQKREAELLRTLEKIRKYFE